MFEASLLSSGRTRRTRGVIFSAVAQVVLVAVAVIAPLVVSKRFEPLAWLQPMAVPMIATMPPEPHVRTRRVLSGGPALVTRPASPPDSRSNDNRPATPVSIPVAPDVRGHDVGGGEPMLPWVVEVTPNAPPSPPAARRARTVIIGGAVQQAKCVVCPAPFYPVLARATRTQGSVLLSARIGRDGTIKDLRVTSGPALLINAARNAVAQWRYEPTLLNGERVEVETEIEVRFTLRGGE